MDGTEALAVLGLRPGAGWAEIKNAFRRQIRSHHPDLTGRSRDASVAAEINEAYAILAGLAEHGQLPKATPETPAPEADRDLLTVPAPSVLVVPTGNLFERLLEAAHDVGDVSYADAEAGTVQLLVTLPGWPASQLTCQVAVRGSDPVIISTLDSLDNRPAPPIRTVVDLLAQQLTSS